MCPAAPRLLLARPPTDHDRPPRVGAVRWGLSRLSGPRRPRPRVNTGQQHGENAGQEYAVKGSGAADRSHRRAETAYLVEIGEISADQRAEAARDIGKRRRLFA